jgi:hypothetical protein
MRFMNTKYTKALLFAALVAMPAAAQVDLHIESAGIFGTWEPGGAAHFEFLVISEPRVPVMVTVTLAMPPGTTFSRSNASWSCRDAAPGIVCQRTLSPTLRNDLVVDVFMPSNTDGMYDYRGVARITSDQTDPKPANNEGSFHVTVYRTFDVTSDGDFGTGTLRAAIESASERCPPAPAAPPCRIRFASPLTIEPRTPLPPIRACGELWIDGYTSVDDFPPPPITTPRRVMLSGAKVSDGDGLVVDSACNGRGFVVIRALAIGGFPGNGVTLRRGSGSEVISSFIGTDASGLVARPNGLRGVSQEAGGITTIGGCVISGNGRSGIAVWAGAARIGACRIGVGSDGRQLGNGASGVFASSRTFAQVTDSTIAFNREFGVAFAPAAFESAVRRNAIFLNGSGTAVDWGMDGPGGGSLPPPVITDAFWDAGKRQTVVRGSTSGTNPFTTFDVDLYATAPGRRDAFAWIGSASLGVLVDQFGKFTFTTPFDLRGYAITAALSRWDVPDLPEASASSEYCEAVAVHP